MNNPSIRAVVSLVLVAIGAIIYLDKGDAAFVVTETAPAVQPVKPVTPPKPSPKPAPAPIAPAPSPGAEPAEIVCTFRCDYCKRAPSLTYHEGDALPLWATCKNCGRSMPRTDPKLNADE